MPKAAIAARGGAVRVRTQKLSGGRYRHIYVVREAGPRGGHTIAGEKPDVQPNYKMRPRGRSKHGQK